MPFGMKVPTDRYLGIKITHVLPGPQPQTTLFGEGALMFREKYGTPDDVWFKGNATIEVSRATV